MKLENLSDCNYLIYNLADGDNVPAGGSMLGGPATFFLKNDSARMGEFFTRYLAGVEKMNNEAISQGLMNYLTSYKINCSFDVFKKSHVFASAMKAIYPDFKENFSARMDKFFQNNACLSGNLSDGHAACLEVSVLGAQCLEKAGLETSVLMGEVLDNANEQYPSDHTVVLIKDTDQTYILDAVNFEKYPDGNWGPSLYTIENDQYDALFKHVDPSKRRMAEARHIFSNQIKYFGYGDRTSITADELVPQSKNNKLIS
jgi:hypothetical protein